MRQARPAMATAALRFVIALGLLICVTCGQGLGEILDSGAPEGLVEDAKELAAADVNSDNSAESEVLTVVDNASSGGDESGSSSDVSSSSSGSSSMDPVSELCMQRGTESSTCTGDGACVVCHVATGEQCLAIDDCETMSICASLEKESDCVAGGCSWCDESCLDLARDACGVCGGDNASCTGCDGIANATSVAVVDPCGVCGGDGTSCYALSMHEYIGIILALIGNSLISVSLNLQKHAHNTNETLKVPYVQLKMWWIGQALMVFGECGNFLAYAYAPATLVAPLGSVTVILNSLLSHFFLKEPLLFRNLMGCLLAVLGSVLIVMYAPTSDKELTMELLQEYIRDPGFMVYIAIVVVSVLVLLFVVPERLKKRFVIIYVLICSLSGAITVMCTKGLSTAIILTIAGNNQFTSFLPWVLLGCVAVTIVIQIRYLNFAMMSYGASEVVPVYYVLFTLSSVVSGLILYKEFHEPDHVYTLYFLLGVLMTFGGVGLITSGPRDHEFDRTRQQMYEKASLLTPDELWEEANDLNLWGSDDEEGGAMAHNSTL